MVRLRSIKVTVRLAGLAALVWLVPPVHAHDASFRVLLLICSRLPSVALVGPVTVAVNVPPVADVESALVEVTFSFTK